MTTSKTEKSPTSAIRALPKLTRAEAIKLVKQEEPTIDFSANDVHAACSLSQLDYLGKLGRRLRSFHVAPDFPGSMGRAVYEYLCRHKFIVFQLFTKGLKDHWLQTHKWMQTIPAEYAFLDKAEAQQKLDKMRKQQPERKHKLLEMYMTQPEFDKKA